MFKTLLVSLGVLLFMPVVLAVAERAPTVVLISVDGLPADYFADPRAGLPTLRMMAKGGARAERMLSVFPTVTWPIHTSMVTGVMPARHGVLDNNYYDRATRQPVALIWDPVFDKEDIVRAPTIYDVAHRAGLRTAGIAWPASRNARHLDWQVPCMLDPAALARHTTPSLLAVPAYFGITDEKKAEWSKIEVAGNPLRDWMNLQLAKHVLQTHRPNLLLLHLVLVDAINHRNGRNSPESYWAANMADHYLRELIETAKAAGLGDRTTFIVVSDHGFLNYTKQININAVLRDMGLIKTAGNRIVESRAYFHAAGGGAGIYIFDEPNRAAIAGELVQRLKSIEGVATVLIGDELVAQGQPLAATDHRAPDIMLSAADGYAFSGRIPSHDVITPITGVKGTHGYLPDQPKMYASFIAWGAAIKPGVLVPHVRVVDIAPTIAAVLGAEMPDVDGRVLGEILR